MNILIKVTLLISILMGPISLYANGNIKKLGTLDSIYFELEEKLQAKMSASLYSSDTNLGKIDAVFFNKVAILLEKAGNKLNSIVLDEHASLEVLNEISKDLELIASYLKE